MSEKARSTRRAFLARAAGGAGVALAGLPSAGGAGEEGKPVPTTSGEHLDQAVRAAIDSKRIGQPVFVRFTFHAGGPAKEARARLLRMAELARGWVGQDLARVQATGSWRGGQVCLALTFVGGASALVSHARGQGPAAGPDLMVLGNHGALYHDPGLANLWGGGMDLGKPADEKLAVDIDRALRTGQPVTPGGGS
jgi:hypothetical protein